jgi:hypothetical protein
MSLDDSSTFDGSREDLRMNCAHILYFVELGLVSVQVFEKFIVSGMRTFGGISTVLRG